MHTIDLESQRHFFLTSQELGGLQLESAMAPGDATKDRERRKKILWTQQYLTDYFTYFRKGDVASYPGMLKRKAEFEK